MPVKKPTKKPKRSSKEKGAEAAEKPSAHPAASAVSKGAKPGIDHIRLFRERVLAITPETKVAILHDTDADGICSAVLVAKAIERLRGGKAVDSVIYQPHKNVAITEDTINRLKKAGTNILFTVDKAVDEGPETVKEASLFFKVITLDHHQVRNDLSDEQILILKAQFISDLDGGKYPTTKLAWDLFNPLVDLSDLDWICAAGTVADGAYGTWKEFVERAMERSNIPVTPDIFDSKIGLVARIIGSAILFDQRNTKKVFSEVMAAKCPSDILSSSIKEFDEKITAELELWISEHKRKALFFPEIELVFYVIHPRYPINSPLSTILSHKYYPQMTLVVVHDSGDPILGISLRRQDYKIDCPSLVRAAVTGLKDAAGGGHIPAAGAKIRREDLEKFLENLKAELKSGKHKRAVP